MVRTDDGPGALAGPGDGGSGAGVGALGVVLGERFGDRRDCGLCECERRPAPGFSAKRPLPLLNLCLLI